MLLIVKIDRQMKKRGGGKRATWNWDWWEMGNVVMRPGACQGTLVGKGNSWWDGISCLGTVV